MKTIAFLLMAFALFACNGEAENNSPETPPQWEAKNYEEYIVGELIDGPANMRAEPNGEILFELENNAVVDVAKYSPVADWFLVGVFFQLTPEQMKSGVLKAGDKIIQENGAAFGTVKTELSPLMMREELAYIEGYTYKDNIQPESFVERKLENELATVGREKKVLWAFCEKNRFEESDQFEGYEAYYFYENFPTDPSPGFRIMLLFQEDILQGVYHSRNLVIPNGEKHEIPEFGNYVTFFEDVPNEQQTSFVAYMNQWLQGVD